MILINYYFIFNFSLIESNFYWVDQINFLILPLPFQLVELFSSGIYIDYILKGGYIVQLFQMENYYVKTYYHIKKNKLVRIVVVDNQNELKPFLKNN